MKLNTLPNRPPVTTVEEFMDKHQTGEILCMVNQMDNGHYLAVIYLEAKTPSGPHRLCLTLETFNPECDESIFEAWMEQMLEDEPWMTRH